MIKKYRFKTKKELVREFGIFYKYNNTYGYVEEMECLLGKPYPYPVKNKYQLRKVNGWNIYFKLLVEVVPNYNPKILNK